MLDLHRADALEAHRRDPAAKRAANEREPVVRDDHVRSLPLPRGTEREQRSHDDERGAGNRKGPGERDEQPSRRGEKERAGERGRQDDPVTSGVEVDALTVVYTHARGFAAALRLPSLREPRHSPHTLPGPLRGQAAARARLTPVCRACNRGEDSTVGQVARKAAVATLVVVGIIALVLALGLVIAAAMRPGIEWLQARRVPRSVGLAVHYLVLAGVVALFLWLVVPRAVDQVGQALGGVPTSRNALDKATRNSTGIKHTVLRALQKRLKKLPAASSLVHASVSVTKTAFEVLIAIFFTFAVAAYWIFERDRARRVVLSLVAREHRKTIRDTWDLIDAKLGAFVRGQLVLTEASQSGLG
ncbi:MAG: AI-2E family transporter [Actinobacteria bacterium]|nr:MAG: AI-2E family transporter [Actinomycetota bacterium]